MMMSTKLLHAVAKLTQKVPLSWLEKTAYALAFLSYYILRIRRKLITKNIQIAFASMDTKTRDKLGFASNLSFWQTILEFFRGSNGSLADNTTIVGKENLTEALAEGKGVFVLCTHMGNWEAMGAATNRQVAPAHIIVKKVGFTGLNAFVDQVRRYNQFLSLYKGEKGSVYRGIKEVLKQKEIIGFVFDQARPNSPRLPLFGKPCKTNTSLAAIWRKNQVPIIPGYIERTAFGRHTVHYLPRIDKELILSNDAEQDYIRHSLLFNQVTEKIITACPSQYFWFHNRWKE